MFLIFYYLMKLQSVSVLKQSDEAKNILRDYKWGAAGQGAGRAKEEELEAGEQDDEGNSCENLGWESRKYEEERSMYQKGSNCSLSCWHSKRKGRDDERREQDTVEIISDELEAAEEKEAFDGNDEEFIEEILVPLIRPAAQQLLAKGEEELVRNYVKHLLDN